MNVELLLDLGWKSAICAGLTLLALGLTGSRSAAERCRLAHVGLLATLLLPLAVLLMPRWEVAALEPASLGAPIAAVAPAARPASEPETALAPQPEPSAILQLDAGTWLPWVYAGPAVFLMLLLFLAVMRLQLLRARAEVLVEPRWAIALAAAQGRLGLKHGTALMVSAELRSPISWGVLRPVILLDPRAAADRAQAETIIAHELAHVARLDWAKLLIGRVATAIYWFNPLVWLLSRRCHELCEEAVDDAVLSADIRNTDYAELLIGSARHDSGAVLLTANGVAGAGALTDRVERVLDSSRCRAPARGWWTLACCAGAVLVSAPLSALTLVGQRSLEVPGTGVAAAGDLQNETAARSASSLAFAEALIEAARRGNVAGMAGLIESGASPDSVLDGDGSPLIAAAEAGRANAISFLLARGADVNLAVRGDGNPLIAAAGAGHTDIVRMLLDRGADIEAAVPDDENALITASRHGSTEVVRLLVARGADVNREVNGRTPLAMAQAGGHTAIAALLTEAGAIR